MAWWNNPEYLTDATEADRAHWSVHDFPDFDDFESEPPPELREVAARNLLQGMAEGKTPQEKILSLPWLNSTSPLPGVETWSASEWTWLTGETAVCPVFVPAIQSGGQLAQLERFDVVVPRVGACAPSQSFRDVAATTWSAHRESAEKARQALAKLMSQGPEQFFLFSTGAEGRGNSASLGIALAVWAACAQLEDPAHPAQHALARDLAVTGHLDDTTAEGLLRAVEFLEQKAASCAPRRLLAPHERHPTGLDALYAANWLEAKARVAPSVVWPTETGFPPTDVLLAFVGPQTEPNLQLVNSLQPIRSVYLIHSSWSQNAAQRLADCLTINQTMWNSEGAAAIHLTLINDRFLNLAERDLHDLLDAEAATSDGPALRAVFGIISGSKFMSWAAMNVAYTRGMPLIYRDQQAKAYSILGLDPRTRVSATHRIPSSNRDCLHGFDRDSVRRCTENAAWDYPEPFED